VAESLGWQFAKLWAASTTSALGSGLATIAAPLFVAAHTANPLIVSATFGVAWLPWLLFALPGGVIVDRVDRRRLMVTIDWIRVAAMSVLATALLAGWAGIGLLDAVLFVINAGEVVFRSASQAMIPSVVPRARLERANGWLVGGTTLMQQMIAGPLGGFLFVVAACIPFFVNAGTYAVSAVLVGLLAGTYRASSRPEPDGDGRSRQPHQVRTELAEGFRWLAHQRVLRTMTALIGLLNLTLTAATAVLVLLVKERLHLGPVGYGTLFSCEAAGAILGSACGDRLIEAVTATWTIRSACWSRRGCTSSWPRRAVRISSGSCCSRSACTPRCGPSWAARYGSGSRRRRCSAGSPARARSSQPEATAPAPCSAA
jgi:hypothetical protein